MTIEVVEFLQNMQNGFFDFFFNFISFLGEEYIYILILGTIYYAINKKFGEYLAFTLFFTGLLNSTIKVIVNAPRPFQKYPDRVTNLRPETSEGFSFPSGHTQNFTAFLFAGGFKLKNMNFIIVASVLSALMGMSRMYLGVHFLEDVAVGLVLGIITAYALSKLFYQLSDKQLFYLNIGVLVFFLPFLLIYGDESFFKGYGLMVGFTFAMMFEKKYVNFSLNVSTLKKVIRVVSGLLVMVSIQLGLGIVFDLFAEEGTMLLHILDLVRYGLIAFVGLGLYPLLFQKLNF